MHHREQFTIMAIRVTNHNAEGVSDPNQLAHLVGRGYGNASASKSCQTR